MVEGWRALLSEAKTITGVPSAIWDGGNLVGVSMFRYRTIARGEQATMSGVGIDRGRLLEILAGASVGFNSLGSSDGGKGSMSQDLQDFCRRGVRLEELEATTGLRGSVAGGFRVSVKEGKWRMELGVGSGMRERWLWSLSEEKNINPKPPFSSHFIGEGKRPSRLYTNIAGFVGVDANDAAYTVVVQRDSIQDLRRIRLIRDKWGSLRRPKWLLKYLQNSEHAL
ncbi:hypothetical protein M5K25_010966 [Dendrobium thyrsiflorum]|uniref:Uncharacterized protein n=1 Tax=Dendrobium thyrsiflorum TaxID=117978 RepID=A0ABD0V131_DENTH